MNTVVTIQSCAIESPCKNHRFYLERKWSRVGVFGIFICQNPSIADHLTIDPTVMNCNNLAVRWGWKGFGILNLFTRKNGATGPENLPESDDHFDRLLKTADIIVAAWGDEFESDERTAEIIRKLPGEIFCIDINESGNPRHPARIDVAAYPNPKPFPPQKAKRPNV